MSAEPATAAATPLPAYPAAPWRLRGRGACMLRRVPVQTARREVPPWLAVVPVAPGATLGLVYCARYEAGSTLRYSELIVMSALVRLGTRIGGWISHIYVDDAAAMAGGRGNWGLPKQLAEFAWDNGSVTVRRTGCVLCTLHSRPRLPLGRLPVAAPAFGVRGATRCWFLARGSARLAAARFRLEVPASSPLAGLETPHGRGIRFERLDGRVPAPAEW